MAKLSNAEHNQVYEHPIMDPIVNSIESFVESRQATGAATIGTLLVAGGEATYVAATEATANGPAGVTAAAFAIMSVPFGIAWRKATRQ